MQQKIIPYDIISKYLAGEADVEETVFLDSWRGISPDNERIFQQLRETWMLSNISETAIPDKEAVWGKIMTSIQKTKHVPLYKRSFMVRVVSIAAIVALIIGFSISFLILSPVNREFSGDIIVKAPKGQKSEIILPDGTMVWLNSGSSISYDNTFNQNKRSIILSGEAFFDVMHDEKRAFEVLAGDIQIKVHGTAFGVKAYNEDQFVDVSLKRGHVTVNSLSSDQLVADLKPNQKAVIAKNTLACNIKNCNAEIENVWRYGKLHVENESISDVIVKMSRWYGVNMSVQGKLKNECYWFTIKTESLTEMLNLIDKITPINYSINGEEVTIRYR